MKTLQFIADCPKHGVIIIHQMNAISRKNMVAALLYKQLEHYSL